jgi:hypothetical protein
MCGVGVGAIQAATPLAFWWLDSAIVYALGLAAVAAIHVGFAVADGRVKGMAAPHPLCGQHALVASVLPGRRLDRGRGHRGRDRRRLALPVNRSQPARAVARSLR